MKLSWKLLHDFLPEQVSPARVAQILTVVGLEVEDIEEYSSLENLESSRAWENCVVAEVLQLKAHPKARNLHIAVVDYGSDCQEVICGAPNLAKGQKVILAKKGAVLHSYSGKQIRVASKQIGGIASVGMLCSEAELGLSADSSGIMVLPAEAQKGMQAQDYFQVYEDTLFTVAITPNRVDLMSHYAVAAEILAYENYHNQQKRQLHNPSFARSIPYSGTQMEIKIMQRELCARYTGIGVKNVQVQPSPKWMQDRLRALGIRCINNIVDLSNYILLAYGNPVHAYDATQIQGRKIIVRQAEAKERITLLNNQEYKLHPADILIADAEGKPLALAGVMGGKDSAITAHTQQVFFEIAHFNSANIKATAERHALNSEAAQYFAKGTDVEGTMQILKSLLHWLLELCPQVQLEGACVDMITHNLEPRRIRLQYSFVEQLSGKQYSREQMRKILLNLGFEILNETKEEMELKVPLRKQDIHHKYDIVEEIMRLDGLDNIPVAETHTIQLFPKPEQTQSYAESANKLAFRNWQEDNLNYLSALGWREIMTNTIVDKANYGYTDPKTWVELENPLSAVHNILRPDTLYSGLEVIAFNRKRQLRQIQCFELGKKYAHNQGKYQEQELLSLWLTGYRNSLSWHNQLELSDIYQLKGVLEALLSRWRILAETAEQNLGETELFSHAYAYTWQGQQLALWGEVRLEHRAHFDLEDPVYFATLALAEIYPLLSHKAPIYQPSSPFPALSRDLALLLPLDYAYSELIQAIRKLNIPELQQITLFDRFVDSKWPDQHSLAIRFTFQSAQATFTEEQIREFMQRILSCIQSSSPAILREN